MKKEEKKYTREPSIIEETSVVSPTGIVCFPYGGLSTQAPHSSQDVTDDTSSGFLSWSFSGREMNLK